MSRRICTSATIAVFALACSCKSENQEKETAGAKAQSGKSSRGARQGLTYAVDVLPVEAKPVTYVVAAPGHIEAFERVQVTSRVAGAVDRVAFTEGQQVKRGQILVLIDSARYQMAVESAKAAMEKARAAQGDAEAMVNRRQGASVQHPGLIPGEEIETYRTKSLTAKADTQVAEQALKTAELNLRDSSVRAPMDGVIQTRSVETGQYVQAGYLMGTLLRRDPMLLRFEVEVAEAQRIKPPMMAEFTLRETPNIFNAKITLVAAAADSTSHMVSVTAELVDNDHKYWLRPGSFCDVTVELERAQRVAPTIPRLAARATDHGYVAYVVEEEVAKERPLVLGMTTKDGWVEVRSGLSAGDLLVVRGAEALSSGAKVKATRIDAAALAQLGTAVSTSGPETTAGSSANVGEPASPTTAGPRRRRDGDAGVVAPPAFSGSEPMQPSESRARTPHGSGPSVPPSTEAQP
jgi:membrane fusion protein, multidrug efflux system